MTLALILPRPATPQGTEKSAEPEEPGPAVTVVLEFVVEDGKRRPVRDLSPQEVEVFQDATRQPIARFEPQREPGHYEVSYVPLSGETGAVTVRVLRPGVQARGPKGSFLKPRIIRALAPLEAALAQILRARPQADDLDCSLAVLRFESGPKGIRHTVAVELPLSELRLRQEKGRYVGRVQILALVQHESGQLERILTEDLPLDTGSEQGFLGRPLVWTASIPLSPGRYKVEALVRELITERASVRTLAFATPAVGGGLRISSVTLLQPRVSFFFRDTSEGDPFIYRGIPLMPTLRLLLPSGADAGVRFFVAIYPDSSSPEAVSLRLELHRQGNLVGEVPIALPPPEQSGEIHYVGFMPSRTFRTATYLLRVVARQGQAVATEETTFIMSP
jgi:hypothetical protein